jgi:hypothetical protein
MEVVLQHYVAVKAEVLSFAWRWRQELGTISTVCGRVKIGSQWLTVMVIK